MAKNKNKSEKREKKKLAEDEADVPVSKKKKKQIAEVPEESAPERSPVTPQDPIGTEDLTPEELRVLERKLKKERKKEEKKLKREQERLALAGETKEEPTKPRAGELALEYLKRWSKKHPEWKFQKLRQTWLLMNMYDPEKIPNKHFKRLLKYLQGLKGSARETTIQQAEKYMKECDGRETQDEAEEQKLNRIREVLQLLS
ncbi:protein cholesin [Leptodactylus fuscus]|uniref:protein cholesin n=1 Tax=Leptodactylus fuscus TaxID=238119 RepID=UPI003F4F0422